MLNLTRASSIYDNINGKDIEDIILKQIQIHRNNATIRKRWENTKTFIEYMSKISDENLFL